MIDERKKEEQGEVCKAFKK